MNDWAFAQIDTDRFLLLEGPLTAHDQPNDGETMLYAPGYFLRDGPSWISGSRCCFLSRKEWEAHFPRVDVKNDWGVVCGRPDKTAFKDAFDRLQELFSRGVLNVVVKFFRTHQ